MKPISTITVINVHIHDRDNQDTYIRNVRTWPATEEGGNAAWAHFKHLIKDTNLTAEELEECLDDGRWEGSIDDGGEDLVEIVWST